MSKKDPFIARELSSLLEDGSVTSLTRFRAGTDRVMVDGVERKLHSTFFDPEDTHKETCYVWLERVEPELELVG